MASPFSFVETTWTTLAGSTPINALLSTLRYEQTPGQPLNLTFSFPYANGAASWSVDYGNGEDASGTALNGAQQQAVRDALQAWANVANVTFTEVAETSSAVGDMRFGFADLPNTYAAWAYLPSDNPEAGDVWLNDTTKAQSFGIGTWNYMTLVHEIGHALGLKHPHEAQWLNPAIMPSSLDSVLYTVMSYIEPPGASSYSRNTSTIVGPMLYDIAAIQHLFGANMNYRAGNDVYSFNQTTAFNTTIWDAGGVDVIDLSGATGAQSLNLVAGSEMSIVLNNARKGNLWLAFGVTIENAVGGSGDDRIIGNDAANDLSGGGGRDTLDGGGGNDILRGGSGTDTARFSGLSTGYTWHQNADGSWRIIALASANGEDTLHDIEWLEFADTRIQIGTAASIITGTGGNDRLTGTAEPDTIEGLAGNDSIDGGSGDDILIGGAGADRLTGGAGHDIARYDAAVSVNLAKTRSSTGDARGDTYSGIEAFEFGNGADSFLGGKAADIASGGAGNDTLNGGAGNDTLNGGADNDILTGGAGVDRLTGGTGADRFVFAGAGDLGDVISDYDGSDLLQFSARAFGRPGTLALGQTLIVNDNPVSAVAKKATFLFDTDTGVLSFDRDGTGKAGAVVVATLTGVTALDANDFLFV
jgi:serralysin